MPILTKCCAECGGLAAIADRNGNDPSAVLRRCEQCEDGAVPAWCTGCDQPAEAFADGHFWCLDCWAEQARDQLEAEKGGFW